MCMCISIYIHEDASCGKVRFDDSGSISKWKSMNPLARCVNPGMEKEPYALESRGKNEQRERERAAMGKGVKRNAGDRTATDVRGKKRAGIHEEGAARGEPLSVCEKKNGFEV